MAETKRDVFRSLLRELARAQAKLRGEIPEEQSIFLNEILVDGYEDRLASWDRRYAKALTDEEYEEQRELTEEEKAAYQKKLEDPGYDGMLARFYQQQMLTQFRGVIHMVEPRPTIYDNFRRPRQAPDPIPIRWRVRTSAE